MPLPRAKQKEPRTPSPEVQQDPAVPEGTSYVLSEPAKAGAERGSSLQSIAAIAHQLKEGELRVLMALAAEAESNHRKTSFYTARLSSRELAKRTRMARPAIQKSIDSLTEKRLITTRQGTATQASGYIVHALDTVLIGGSLGMPPPTQKQGGVALQECHQVALFESQGGSLGMPPPYLTRARNARASIFSI